MLIAHKNIQVFDMASIRKGDCIRVKYKDSPMYRNGFVTEVTEEKLHVLYSNEAGNATSYFVITASAAAAGLWEIRWTTDFITVHSNEGLCTMDGGINV